VLLVKRKTNFLDVLSRI